MSYEVRKTIGGREYRYLVESYRDPETGKPRNKWRYLGKALGGSPPRRRAAGAQTRANLTAALGRLLGRTAWDEITARDIAAEAGVTPATLYRYFASRDDLLRDWSKGANDRFETRLTQLHAIANDVDAERARLRAWLLALWASGVADRAANEHRARHVRMFERYLELLCVHGYATIVARDRPALAVAVSLMVPAQVRKDEHQALAGAIERLIFA